jgi:menaquinol-cytochrome c reductase cytochrome b/c subunit
MYDEQKRVVSPSNDAKKSPVRIAIVKRTNSAQLHRDEPEMVMTLPHLVIREAIAFMILVIVLVLVSLFVNAPLETVADPLHTPNPAKAPWYFLGLQELLHYWPPVVAGVVLPVLAVLSLVVIPYFDINLKREGLWEQNPEKTMRVFAIVVGALIAFFSIFQAWVMVGPTIVATAFALLPRYSSTRSGFIGFLARRPLAHWVMIWFLLLAGTLTATGTLFRGPEWRLTLPWVDGVY